MNNIYIPARKPMSWWDMVTPREEEMPNFLRSYMGKGMQFRTPKRMWEDLWRLKRGEMNHILGMRKSTITNRKGPKFQRGMLHPIGMWVPAGGTQPNMQDITESRTNAAPTQQRLVFAYDSDGSIEHDILATTAASIVYTDLTTQTDDANTHTNDWWPDQPDVNEGLNWDIRYLNEVETFPNGQALSFRLTTGVDRVSGTWYTIDVVSNDHADAGQNGCFGMTRQNGTAKTPVTGTSTHTADLEIRTTTSGSAVTSMAIDMTLIATSDIRLKKNIIFIGEINNIRIYTWEWNAKAITLGVTDSTIGVLAQEVQKTYPSAVFKGEHGYLKVNYGKIFS